MIKQWIEDYKCTGCGACSNVCPENAINMVENCDGFLHPEISEKCIECGLCKCVCERRTRGKKSMELAYSVTSKDGLVRFTSTSGGVFFELAKCIIEAGGIVVGASFDGPYAVAHTIATSISELECLKRSKYVQSDSRRVFYDVKSYLEQDAYGYVLFAGTPCQVGGLRAVLGKEYPNLICVDFICHGVNSPLAYRTWLHEIERQQRSKVELVWFKYKIHGWTESPRCTKIMFENGENIVLGGKCNTYMDGYIGYDLYTRPSCTKCDFKGVNRVSDITVADFWDIPADQNDDKGTSLVIINSKSGDKIWRMVAENCNYERINYDRFVRSNRVLNESVEANSIQKYFFWRMKRLGFENAYIHCKRMCDKKNLILHYKKRILKMVRVAKSELLKR